MVWRSTLAGGSKRRVARGHTPRWSPGRCRVAFVNRDGPVRDERDHGAAVRVLVRGARPAPADVTDPASLARTELRLLHARGVVASGVVAGWGGELPLT
jgi:hypothetical protein